MHDPRVGGFANGGVVMRILEVVTLISPDGAYGGPTRVALNQSAELQTRGIDVEVTAGTSGFASPPRLVDGIPVRLFRAIQLLPKSGFAGLAAPAQVWWFLRSRRRFDAVHVHLARDLVTPIIAGIALLLRKPVYVQTHGMIDTSDRLLSIPFDLLLIRPILRRAAAVFCLTHDEARDLSVVERRCRVVILPNGVPAAPAQPATRTDSAHRPVRVLYLARLQERKRPAVLVRSALTLLGEGRDVQFALVGPDEGQAGEVTRLIEESGFASRINWEGPIEPSKTLSRMTQADLYVLPSVNEPFPMAVLEAMSIGLPAIVTDSCGLAPAVAGAEAGAVVGDSEASLTAAIDRYLRDPEMLRRHGANAHALASASFSMTRVGDILMREYGVSGDRDEARSVMSGT